VLNTHLNNNADVNRLLLLQNADKAQTQNNPQKFQLFYPIITQKS